MVKREVWGSHSPPPDQEEGTLETKQVGKQDCLSGNSHTRPVLKESGSPFLGMSMLMEKEESAPCQRQPPGPGTKGAACHAGLTSSSPAISCETRSNFPNPSELHLNIKGNNSHLTWLLGRLSVRKGCFQGKWVLGVVPGAKYNPGYEAHGKQSLADTQRISWLSLRTTLGIRAGLGLARGGGGIQDEQLRGQRHTVGSAP